MNVVIVGGGIAGVSTAVALRSGGFDGPVTLVDAGPFPYDRPPLTKDFLAGRRDHEQIALQPPQWYDQQSVRLVNRATVTALRPAEARIELADGRALPADRVVLATGGRAARPPIPGADATRVHTLRTVEDAERLRAALGDGVSLLVVGAGLIGAELAATAAGLGCAVTLTDPVAPPLADAVGPGLAGWLHDCHAARGITTLRSGVTALHQHAGGISAELTGDDSRRLFDLVVLGVGMVPETGLAEAAGLAVDRGIVVDAGQVTSNPAVLAVGDPARPPGGVRAEHWEAAQLDGVRAAATLLGQAAPPAGAPWFWTDRHGHHVEVVGRMADAEQTVERGALGDPAYAVFGLRGARVVAAAAVDDSNAVRTARRLIDRRIDTDPRPLADRGVNLRSLLRG